MRMCAKLIAAGFVPRSGVPAPGTVGSVVALTVWWLLHVVLPLRGTLIDVVLSGVVIIAGWWATSVTLNSLAVDGEGDTEAHKDPQWIVIDEWAGMFITLIGVDILAWHSLVAAFLLFRFFDVTKLGPVGWAERLPRASGIMADDIVAGVCALGVRLLLEWFCVV